VAAAGLSSQDLYGVQRIHSYAGYGQATFPIVADTTDLTLGLRYTSDKVHGVGIVSGVIPGVGTIPFVTYDKTFDFHKMTYRVALDQHFTRDVMGYVSVGRGYKSGTFNTLPLTADPSNPEVVDSYELGLKTELLDRRLRVNVAIFQNNIKDPQVQTVVQGPGGTSFVGLTNAAKARSRGVEAELQAIVTDGLQLRFGGALLEAEYTDFKNGPVAFPILNAQGNPTAPYGLKPLTTQDESGSRMAQVPKTRFNAGLSYEVWTSVGHFNADANASYTSEFPWEPDGIIRQEAYTLVGASLEWTPPSQDRLSLRLWGKNLTGKEYYVTQLEVAGSQQGNNAVAAEPRTFGVEARYRF
jgi:iron complex outermembrane receptor protein